MLPAVAMLFVMAIGCSPKLHSHVSENVAHEVMEKEMVRDTVVQVQPDSSIVQALIRCDSTGRARLEEIRTLRESSRMRQTLAVKSPAGPYQPMSVTVKAVVDSMGIYLTFKERYREEQHVRTVENIIEKEVNVLKWWQKVLMWFGAASSVAAFCYAIRLFRLRS